MRDGKPRIRVTELGMYLRCAYQYYFLKTVGPRPPSWAATTGTSFHAAMEVNFKEKALVGIDAPVDVCTDAFNDKFKDLLLDTDWADKKPSEMLKTGMVMVKSALKNMTPAIDVASEDDVEKHFIIDCGDFEISGTTDLLRPELAGTIDWKTAGKMWYQGRANKEIQGFLYPMGVTPVDREIIPHSFNIVSYAGKTGEFPVQHSRRAAEYLVRCARRALKMVDTGEEPDVGPYQLYCSEKMCGWSGICPMFGKE